METTTFCCASQNKFKEQHFVVSRFSPARDKQSVCSPISRLDCPSTTFLPFDTVLCQIFRDFRIWKVLTSQWRNFHRKNPAGSLINHHQLAGLDFLVKTLFLPEIFIQNAGTIEIYFSLLLTLHLRNSEKLKIFLWLQQLWRWKIRGRNVRTDMEWFCCAWVH